MNNPLMPKSTAVWLIDNTALTFEQISKFCNLHILEVQGIADGEVLCDGNSVFEAEDIRVGLFRAEA